jgi:hypothetical protein
MSFQAILGDTIPKYIRLSKTEAKILNTIAVVKRGNAYGLWKTSGLKHYPTVLRTLKKLEKKRLVQALSESGTRGERIYVPTLVGTLVSYVFNGEKKKIVKMVEENSSLFRELYKMDRDEDWAFVVAEDIISDFYRKKEPRSFDEAIEDRLQGLIVDNMVDFVHNKIEKGMEWILKFSKIKWIRELAIREIEGERTRLRQATNSLDELARKVRTTT